MSYTYHSLKFKNKAQWKRRRAKAGFVIDDEGRDSYPFNVDIIGANIKAGTYDEEGNELTPPVKKKGYLVNIATKDGLPTEFAKFEIFPLTPNRVYSIG